MAREGRPRGSRGNKHTHGGSGRSKSSGGGSNGMGDKGGGSNSGTTSRR
jgi:hypothetical protein